MSCPHDPRRCCPLIGWVPRGFSCDLRAPDHISRRSLPVYLLILTIEASASYPSSSSVFIAAERSVGSSAFLGASQCRRTTSSPTHISTSHFDFAPSHETSTSSARIVPPVFAPARIVIQRTPLEHPRRSLAPLSSFRTPSNRV